MHIVYDTLPPTKPPTSYRQFGQDASRGPSAIAELLVLYAVESCPSWTPLLARQTLSFEFTLTRIFMKLFRTGSSKVVYECQASFGFLPAKNQIRIRTASFLQKFTASENSLCCLRMMRAGNYIIFSYNLVTIARQLRNAVFC